MKRFTPDEDAIIKQMFGFYTLDNIGKKLGRSLGSIHGRSITLGLKLTPEQKHNNMMIGIKKGWAKREIGLFKKGHEPWNKGLKGIRLNPATEFKKGMIPHNTKFDGCISTRTDKRTKLQYQYIRVSKGKWELLHRYNWVKKYGPIPEGMIVVFKTENRMNCETENLKMISFAENMKLNTIQNYPPEVVKVVQILGVLNRQINKHKQVNHG